MPANENEKLKILRECDTTIYTVEMFRKSFYPFVNLYCFLIFRLSNDSCNNGAQGALLLSNVNSIYKSFGRSNASVNNIW
jgi:hypothetical protein